jgi:RecA/RadA recombinase
MSLQELKNRLSKKYSNIQIGKDDYQPLNFLSTGLVNLDLLLGGGIPKGMFTEIVGDSDIGKTSLLGQLVKASQQSGEQAAFLATEAKVRATVLKERHSLDDFFFAPCVGSGEKTMSLALDLAQSGEFSLIILDSLADVMPKQASEIDKSGNVNRRVADQSKVFSDYLHIIAEAILDFDVAFVWVNQLRANISKSGYGPDKKPAGGNIPKYKKGLGLKLNKSPSGFNLKGTYEDQGTRVQIETEKIQHYRPGKTEFVNLFKTGPNPYLAMQDTLIEREIYNRAGAWYNLKEEYMYLNLLDKCQGADKISAFLMENSEVYSSVYKFLLDTFL